MLAPARLAHRREHLLVRVVRDVQHAHLGEVRLRIAHPGEGLEPLAHERLPLLQLVVLGELHAARHGEHAQGASPALRVASAWATTSDAPWMLWLFRVKSTTSVSGAWIVQMPDVSATPVRLSMRT